jgi:hypothetical protein
VIRRTLIVLLSIALLLSMGIWLAESSGAYVLYDSLDLGKHSSHYSGYGGWNTYDMSGRSTRWRAQFLVNANRHDFDLVPLGAGTALDYGLRLVVVVSGGFIHFRPAEVVPPKRATAPNARGVSFGTALRIPIAFSMLAISLSLALLVVVPGYVRLRRSKQGGCCVDCGYDLRGHTASGQCPECGGSFGIAADVCGETCAHCGEVELREVEGARA